MTVYTEKNSLSLLSGSSDADGDTITVRRLNGAQITSWPHTISLTTGSAIVAENGGVTFDDEGSISGHPANGVNQANGSFTFTLWDGVAESGTYTADVSLDGISTSNPSAATVRASHEAMITTTGRKSGAPLIDIDVNNLPTGMSYNSGFNYVNINSGSHSNYRFLNVDVVAPNGANATLSESIIERTQTTPVGSGNSHQVDIYPAATLNLQSVEIIDTYGESFSSSAIRQRPADNGMVGTTDNAPNTWTDVLCRWQSNDGVKPSGNVTINQMVIAAPSNVPDGAFVDQGGGVFAIPLWSPTLFMPAGSYVRKGTSPGANYTYLVLSSNTGGALPSDSSPTNSNALFQGKDPHVDQCNFPSSKGQSTCTDFVIVRDCQSLLLPVAWRSWAIKQVNAFRMIPNSNLTGHYDKVTLDRCSVIGQGLDSANNYIDAGPGTNTPSYDNPEFVNCLFDTPLSGYVNDPAHVDWTDNRDWEPPHNLITI